MMPVYFIAEDDNGGFPIKIGVARDVRRRRKNLQTGNPSLLKIMGWIKSENDFNLENSLHKLFSYRHHRGEWFDIEAADILPILTNAGRDGFVGKNADAFQIVSYDKDAVPEYLGVWEWGDLELNECCSFCGCLCGMHFQDASQMYYCINCDALTNFSELSPHCDDERDY